MTKHIRSSLEDYQKCKHIYEQFLKIVIEDTKAEYAVPLGADIILHEKFLRTRTYEEYCIEAYGKWMHHNSECYGTERFWNAWSNTCRGFQKTFGLSLEKESNAGNLLLAPSECAIMKIKQ